MLIKYYCCNTVPGVCSSTRYEYTAVQDDKICMMMVWLRFFVLRTWYIRTYDGGKNTNESPLRPALRSTRAHGARA